MKPDDPMLQAVIQAVKSVAPKPRAAVRPKTQILTDLDLDSMQMLELTGLLEEQFGTDLLDPAYSIEVLRTPETIVAALQKAQATRTKKGG